jgi:hypothetical protein
MPLHARWVFLLPSVEVLDDGLIQGSRDIRRILSRSLAFLDAEGQGWLAVRPQLGSNIKFGLFVINNRVFVATDKWNGLIAIEGGLG